MAWNRIAKDRTRIARWTRLRDTAAEESIDLGRIVVVEASVDRATRRSRRCWCRRAATARAGIGARAWARRPGSAEVLRKGVAGTLHTRNILLIAPRLYRPEDDVKAMVRVALIQAHFEIRRLIVIVEIHRTPFNVKDPIGRTA